MAVFWSDTSVFNGVAQETNGNCWWWGNEMETVVVIVQKVECENLHLTISAAFQKPPIQQANALAAVRLIAPLFMSANATSWAAFEQRACTSYWVFPLLHINRKKVFSRGQVTAFKKYFQDSFCGCSPSPIQMFMALQRWRYHLIWFQGRHCVALD